MSARKRKAAGETREDRIETARQKMEADAIAAWEKFRADPRVMEANARLDAAIEAAHTAAEVAYQVAREAFDADPGVMAAEAIRVTETEEARRRRDAAIGGAG